MQELEYLKQSTKSMLPIDMPSDLTIYYKESKLLIYLTHVFDDHHFLGFWSHSPWGRVHNMEKGWVLINHEFEIVDSCATIEDGEPAGNDFRSWRKQVKEDHGKATKLAYEWSNELIWKITET